jgi:hypothetical protein
VPGQDEIGDHGEHSKPVVEKWGGFQPEHVGPAPTVPPPKPEDAARSARPPALRHEHRVEVVEAEGMIRPEPDDPDPIIRGYVRPSIANADVLETVAFLDRGYGVHADTLMKALNIDPLKQGHLMLSLKDAAKEGLCVQVAPRGDQYRYRLLARGYQALGLPVPVAVHDRILMLEDAQRIVEVQRDPEGETYVLFESESVTESLLLQEIERLHETLGYDEDE